jgi:hypothetical protein
MSTDDYLELVETAKAALADVIQETEPGTGLTLHYAYRTLKDMVKEDGRSRVLAEERAKREERDRRWAEQTAAWNATAGERRQRMILEALGDDRLTVGQLAKRMAERHGEEFGSVYDSMLRGEVGKMLAAGELDRIREDFRNRPRYLYFRKPGLSGPIADLEALLDHESGNR